MDANRLLTTTLRTIPQGAIVTRIMAAALNAVDPAEAVRRHVQRSGEQLWIDDRCYHLADYDRILLVGLGKAGVPMALAAAEIAGDRLAGGVIIVKDGHADTGHPPDRLSILNSQFSILESGHPVPDERGVAGAQRIVELLAETSERDLVLALISGGGSALVTRPVPGMTLADIQALTQTLLACGATINEINTLRKHLDQIKGGGLARLAAPATVATLVLSDVIGDPLDVIASGPTVPDTTTFADAVAILEKYGITSRTPASILAYLRQGIAGRVVETPKPGSDLFKHVQNVIVGSNSQACAAAEEAARAEGLHVIPISQTLVGEAREVGEALARLVLQADAQLRPLVFVGGGETTVTLRGDGKGGRNQELALAAVQPLAGAAQVLLVALATDGGDGPTDAAGAVVAGATLARALALGLDADASLARNDAYYFFAALGDLLLPGPTQTNVCDLALVFRF